MTADEADERIILSRQTLYHYVQMLLAGDRPGPENLAFFGEEISVLEAIADEHPAKALKLERIVEGWQQLQASVKSKLH